MYPFITDDPVKNVDVIVYLISLVTPPKIEVIHERPLMYISFSTYTQHHLALGSMHLHACCMATYYRDAHHVYWLILKFCTDHYYEVMPPHSPARELEMRKNLSKDFKGATRSLK